MFRKCFDGFDYDRIAEYDDKDVERIRKKRRIEKGGLKSYESGFWNDK